MTALEILTPVVLLLAFVGYISCLKHRLWVTLALTGALAAFVWHRMAATPVPPLYWAIAFAVVLLALFCVWKFPKPMGDTPEAKQSGKKGGREVVIDGTNVIYWDGEADLRSLRSLVAYLVAKDIWPFVFLDASTRHHLKDTSLTKRTFAKALGLPESRVMVCPAQSEADAFILKFAKEQELPVISNDRFGDRPKQAKGLKLIKGVMVNGKPVLQGL